MALANLEGNLGADGLRQLVDEDIHRLRRAVEVDFHAGRLARAVVGDEHVMPLTGLQGAFGRHLERVVGPFIDDVHGHALIFEPQVPTAMPTGVVHAGSGRAVHAALGKLDPGADREVLVALEIANFDKRRRRARLYAKRLGRYFAGNPSEAGIDLNFL